MKIWMQIYIHSKSYKALHTFPSKHGNIPKSYLNLPLKIYTGLRVSFELVRRACHQSFGRDCSP